MELTACFVDDGGSVVVNFGILTGREATLAEIDRLARSISNAGGEPIRIVAERIQDYDAGVETVLHQVIARAEAIDLAELERLCNEWVQDCAADRHVAPL